MASDRRRNPVSGSALLVRSGTEIHAVLAAMCDDRDVLTASLADEDLLFLSRLLLVEPARQSVVIACSSSKRANHVVLGSTSVAFVCNHRGGHFEFAARTPREASFRGSPAIRLDFPLSLLVGQRRAHRRFKVPSRVPLRCVAEWGPLSFDARVVDISTHGLGTIVYDPGIALAPGTRLRRARIEHPKRTVLVGLEVRHVKRVLLRDGRPVMRAGCRFVGGRHDLEDLIRLFVTELDR